MHYQHTGYTVSIQYQTQFKWHFPGGPLVARFLCFLVPCLHTISGHDRPTRETPSKWHFPGGPLVAHFYMLTR